MGICEVLTIIFVVCKIFGVISWSWWLVLLPEIIAFILYIFIFCMPFILTFIEYRSIHKEFRERKK